MRVQFFNDDIERFIRGLQKPTIAKVLRTLDLLEVLGNRLGMPHSKAIGGEIFELRVRGEQEVRFMYGFFRSGVIILHGFVKKSSRIPRNDVFVAKSRKSLLDRA